MGLADGTWYSQVFLQASLKYLFSGPAVLSPHLCLVVSRGCPVVYTCVCSEVLSSSNCHSRLFMDEEPALDSFLFGGFLYWIDSWISRESLSEWAVGSLKLFDLCAFSGRAEPWHHQNVSSLWAGTGSRPSVALCPAHGWPVFVELSEGGAVGRMH